VGWMPEKTRSMNAMEAFLRALGRRFQQRRSGVKCHP